MTKKTESQRREVKPMEYKYHYYFRFEYSAPGQPKPRIYSAFYVNRCAPIDSHLYYKIRQKAFGAMNDMYWSCRVEIYRADACDDRLYIDIDDGHWLYIGSFNFDHYTFKTCVAAYTFACPGIESHDKKPFSCCWNWSGHHTPYDWSNHTKYNPSMRT